MSGDILFEPLKFRNLTVKNRIFRSNISGRFDNYDGSGSNTRLNWEERFARGGVGAICSSFVPVSIRGRIMPNYATIDADNKIPFWREVAKRVHAYDCRYILQLSHSGRQQDIPGVENQFRKPLSSTGNMESFNGFIPQMMSREDIRQTVHDFGQGARRAREAGLDGVETHSANGYLFTQFLSAGINKRRDEYGGPLENRARFLLEVVAEIRKQVGSDFHFQVKINGADYGNAVFPWEGKGNTVQDTVQICRWLEQAGVDAVHVSGGSSFPHPYNPPGGIPVDWAFRTFDVMLSSGALTFQRYVFFRYRPLRPLFNFFWNRNRPDIVEGINAEAAREIKRHLSIPVLCTGGFQTASVIRKFLGEGYCDAVSIARALVANPNLVQIFASGKDLPDRPCTHCNKCLVNALKNPVGCYELSRFDGDYDRMIREVMSVFHPSPYDPLPEALAAPQGGD
jgi:2,4-dienoyl-CoA reductase (NADPH2)